MITDSFPHRPALDTAVSRAILTGVSEGAVPETLRLYRPPAIVAFGPQDTKAPGYEGAVKAARSCGFEAVQRLTGGRAAVFHEETIAFAWTIPDPAPHSGTESRFEEAAQIMAAAFVALGVDASIGEVEGEYCPGQYSVNARARKKLMGVGQRLTSSAALVGGVVVVGGSRRIRDVLLPVYAALELEWDPSTVGSIREESGSVSYEEVQGAILDEFASRYKVVESHLGTDTLALAEAMESEHIPG